MKKLFALQKWPTNIAATTFNLFPANFRRRSFRSDAALEALAEASRNRVSALAIYNYPSFSGAFSALFAHLFHSRLQIPCLVLPYSSVEPLRVEDLCINGLGVLYLLDFVGPKGFAKEISRRTSCEVIGFDHRKSALGNLPSEEDWPKKVKLNVDVKKSSSVAVYEYFSSKLAEIEHSDLSLLEPKDQDSVDMILKYIEHLDLRLNSLPDVRAFSIGLEKWRSKFNSLTNPYIYEQLLEIRAVDLIAQGNSYISVREKAAAEFLKNIFKVQLGRGLYGECLGVRADENPDLADEIGKKLSVRSAAAGLRPIGAVIFMKRNNNLKMCLRSTDIMTDTSEVARAYGGGGSSSSSSFIIRMDEYNQWRSENPQARAKVK